MTITMNELAPFPFMFLIYYFMMVRPAQKRRRAAEIAPQQEKEQV